MLHIQNWKIFLLLVGLSALTAFAINYLFISEGVYYQSFGEKTCNSSNC
jgi:hypothetical protein